MELIHTCYRITDIDRSVVFYEALGFEERGRLPIGDEAVNVFMGLPGDDDRLELTYNFGVDSYELGTGYGHIAVTVDDMRETLARLKEQGIEPEREPYRIREGGSLLCFVRDPDGLEIQRTMGGTRETVWTYSDSRAAAAASTRRGLTQTFGFDPTLWGGAAPA